jgi:hypothetical protein
LGGIADAGGAWRIEPDLGQQAQFLTRGFD